MRLKPGVYYELRSRFVSISQEDVDGEGKKILLQRGDHVLCEEIKFRSGARGRGRYAMLHTLRDGGQTTFFHRVSNNDISSGQWAEINPMMVIALADQLPHV